MTQSYKITISGNPDSGIPEVNENFGRVTVLVGANGSGKSKLIEKLKQKKNDFGDPRPLAYVEGGRVINPPKSVALNRNNFNQFQNLEKAEQNHKNQKTSELSNRINQTLILLDRYGEKEKAKHSDLTQEWIDGGREGEPPSRSEPPLEKLFRMFQDIFPQIRLEIDDKSKQITCHKNGSKYPPDQLSDGERQVLALLADIGILAEDNSLILVDEPELNLNSHLACRVWDYIEANLPDAVFVYSTHSLGFAMRRNIDQLLVLQGSKNPALPVTGFDEIPNEELRKFLGAVPAILAAPGALIVEGHEASVDLMFYNWVLNNEEYVIVPVGSCENVNAAVKRTGVWKALAPNMNLVGIIDRDYRSDSNIQELESGSSLVLDFHELESYLCDPKLLSNLTDKLGLIEDVPTENFFFQKIREFAEKKKLATAARRVFERASINLSVSLSKQVLSKCKSEEKLKTFIKTAASKEADKVEGRIGEQKVARMFKEELIKINKALDEQDLDKILKLFPGKELLNSIIGYTGCSKPSEVVRTASKHLEISDYKRLNSLRTKLDQLFNDGSVQEKEDDHNASVEVVEEEV